MGAIMSYVMYKSSQSNDTNLQQLQQSYNESFITSNIQNILLTENLLDQQQVYSCPSGDFDYYLLSMSYAPEFCRFNPSKSGTPECTGNYNLVLHGLWPQYLSPRTIDGKKYSYPEFCSSKWANVNNHDLLLILDNIAGWKDIAPEYQDLILHEWNRHGTCSGLSPLEYFTTAFSFAHKIPNPPISSDITKEQLHALFPNGYLQFDKDNDFSGVVFHFSKDGNIVNK